MNSNYLVKGDSQSSMTANFDGVNLGIKQQIWLDFISFIFSEYLFKNID